MGSVAGGLLITTVTSGSKNTGIAFALDTKMPFVESLLPPELESKRLTIARKHNQLTILLSCGLFVLLLGAALIVGRGPHHKLSPWGLVASFLLIGSGEAFGILCIIQHDYELCRRLGYVCPFCQTPLYGRTSPWARGICPKCGKSLVRVLSQIPADDGRPPRH